MESNPVDNAVNRGLEEKLAPVYEDLDFEQSTRLFKPIADLCIGYEQAAFHAGENRLQASVCHLWY